MSNTEYIEKEDKILEDQLDETVIDEVVENGPEEIVEKKSGDIAKVPLYTNKFVEAMNVIAWIELIASAIMAIYIWVNYGTIEYTSGYYYSFTTTEMNPIGVGIGAGVLAQGVVFFILLSGVKVMAEDVAELKNKLLLKEKAD